MFSYFFLFCLFVFPRQRIMFSWVFLHFYFVLKWHVPGGHFHWPVGLYIMRMSIVPFTASICHPMLPFHNFTPNGPLFLFSINILPVKSSNFELQRFFFSNVKIALILYNFTPNAPLLFPRKLSLIVLWRYQLFLTKPWHHFGRNFCS